MSLESVPRSLFLLSPFTVCRTSSSVSSVQGVVHTSENDFTTDTKSVYIGTFNQKFMKHWGPIHTKWKQTTTKIKQQTEEVKE